MSSSKLVFCPACGFIQQPIVNNPRFGLPPTGGDYEWVETDATVNCRQCQHKFEIRIQIDIESGNVNQVSYFPYPDNPALLIYALIHKYPYSSYFHVLCFSDSLESINEIYQDFHLKSPHENNVLIVKINSAGVRLINEELVCERSEYSSLSYPAYPMGFT